MSHSVPAGVGGPVVGPGAGPASTARPRPLGKAGAESIGSALDADPVILRGAVARALETVTGAPPGLPWDQLVATAAARSGGWPDERTAALADPAAAGHQDALWALATELIEDRGRDLATIDLRDGQGQTGGPGREGAP